MDSLRSTGALLGRIMLAYIFVAAGIEKISGPAGTMQYMASAGLPHSLVPELFVLSVIVELLGGLMLIFGWHAELAALIMFLWMIPVTMIFHVSTGQTDRVGEKSRHHGRAADGRGDRARRIQPRMARAADAASPDARGRRRHENKASAMRSWPISARRRAALAHIRSARCLLLVRALAQRRLHQRLQLAA